MSVVINPSFNGFNYAANSCDVTKWEDEARVRSATAQVPRSNINRGRSGFLSPRQVTLEGVIGDTAWTTRDQVRTAEDAFRYAHRNGFYQLQRDSDRYLTAEVTQLTIGEDTGLLYIPYQVRFEAADPYWYAMAADPTNIFPTPLTGNTHQFTNAGGAEAAGKFTFNVGGTGGTLALTFYLDTPVTGTSSFSLNGAVNASDVITVDCYAQTVTTTSSGGTVSNSMNLFTGTFWLTPPGTVTVRVVYTGPSLASIAIDQTQRWL